MADVEVRNILLTPYSTLFVYGNDNTHKFRNMYSEDQEILDIDISNSMEYTEYSFMNKVLVTSESVLKYLVLPKQNKILEGPIKLDKVFAFTTDEVSKPTDGLKRYAVDEDKIIHKYVDSVSVEEFVSDEDFISSRMQAIYDYAQGNPLGTRELKIEPVPIENEKDGIEQNLNNIFDMVDNIIEYIENSKENNVEIRVYVDMTGGFRTIPMYLLFILNVLEKRGIIIEKVYYAQMSSGKKGTQKIQIDDLTQVLKTQDFTNGIHEFIKFGSAQELSVFLKKDLEIDTREEHRGVIENFVNSVESFAEAITISNRTNFEESIDKIKDAWLKLEKIDTSTYSQEGNEENLSENNTKSTENNEKINLLKIFEPRIYNEYKLVWDNPNHLSYIKWCLDHNFIQQALTLYIELIPEILFEKNEYGAILECINEESLRKSYDGGVYKFEYSLLNQADFSVESRKHDLIKSRKHDYFSGDVDICIDILQRLVKCKKDDKDWIESVHKTINESTVKDFFANVQEHFKSNEKKALSNETEFSVDHIKWKRAELDEGMFNKNWAWLIFSLTDLDELANLYEESLNKVVEVLKHYSDLEGLQGEKILEKIEGICYRDIEWVRSKKQELVKKEESVHTKIESVEDITEKDKNKLEEIAKDIEKLEGIERNLTIALLGYLFLKDKCIETLKKCLRDAYIKITENNPEKEVKKDKKEKKEKKEKNKVDHWEIVQLAINEVKRDIEKLRRTNKYALKTNFINMANISSELLAPIILPYTIKQYYISGHPKFDNKIEELDKRFRVEDIQVMIDGDIDGKKKKLKINENLRKALQSGKMQLKPSSKALSIIKDSVEINKLKEIEERYSSLFPAYMGGTAPELDMWNRDNLSLLILRILLYPYHTLKLIRNDSVHAREERQFNVSRKDIKKLITSSIDTIENYLEMCKMTEINEERE